jgi:hypothetical protein
VDPSPASSLGSDHSITQPAAGNMASSDADVRAVPHILTERTLPAVYAAAILVAAFLLFMLEPMFAKMALPFFGGSAAVWNTAVMFYQLALLTGYVYAHYVTSRLPSGFQVGLHLSLVLLVFLALPIIASPAWAPPDNRNPALWLLLLMLLRIGLPFVMLSATSPLFQRWFAGTSHPAAGDPYFLYAASNGGSLLGLLSYPLLIEATIPLHGQSLLWTAGYAIFVVLALVTAVVTIRRQSPLEAVSHAFGAPAYRPAEDGIGVWRCLRWVFLAFLPSSLMLSVTTYLSMEIAPFPLLWVLPLALYLLTFILAFAGKRVVPWPLLARALPIVLVLVVVTFPLALLLPIWLTVGLNLIAFFVIALAFHTALADDRPPARRLTSFYLWLAIGGAIGGIFNALLAPLLFRSVAEYWLGLILAGLLVRRPGGRPAGASARWLDIAWPALLALLMGGGLWAMRYYFPQAPTLVGLSVVCLIPAVLCLSFASRPIRFASGLAAILFVGVSVLINSGKAIYAERNFFGINRVFVEDQQQRHVLVSGNTLHGFQSLDPARVCEPLSYYAATGPIGQVFGTLAAASKRIGVVGLGTGSLAGYHRPGQAWTFYEIDPAVAQIASDQRYFTFLRNCAPDTRVELGDARLSLVGDKGTAYDLLILDAYSGDTVPAHLLTREALALYLDRLASHGVLAFHISNRRLDLGPVVGNLASDAGIAAIRRDDMSIGAEEAARGKLPSQWVLMARDRTDFGELASDPHWQPLANRHGIPVWTDDYSSLLPVIRWR